jgi:hypothetical protein
VRIAPLRKRCLVIGLILWTLCTWVGWANGYSLSESVSHRLYMMDEPVQAYATLHTTLTLAADAELDNIGSIYLAGFGNDLVGMPKQIALVWSEEPEASFWFTWRLQVTAGDRSITLKSTSSPVMGHTYDVWLSYNQVSGDIAIVFTDTTANSSVYHGSIQLPIPIDTAYAGAGYEIKASSIPAPDLLSHMDMELMPRYLPLAYEWQVAARTKEGDYVHTTHINASDELVMEFNAHSIGFGGHFEFSLMQGDKVTVLGTCSSTDSPNGIIMPASTLPFGPSTLTMNYIVEGETALSESLEISVGQAHVHIQSLTFDPQSNSLIGSVELSSDGVVIVDLLLQATVHEMVWNPTKQGFETHTLPTEILLQQPVVIRAGNTDLPVTIPLPPHPGTWHVVFEVAVTPEVRLTTYGIEQYLTTYPPAIIAPGAPYTIAVIPDTQSYTTNYPEVLMRKTQWLAESAQRLNLGLVLHVGDITENIRQSSGSGQQTRCIY